MHIMYRRNVLHVLWYYPLLHTALSNYFIKSNILYVMSVSAWWSCMYWSGFKRGGYNQNGWGGNYRDNSSRGGYNRNQSYGGSYNSNHQGSYSKDGYNQVRVVHLWYPGSLLMFFYNVEIFHVIHAELQPRI